MRQQDTFRCGPVAIINALKWNGHLVKSKDMLSDISIRCKTDRHGTAPNDFGKVLRQYFKSTIHIIKPTMKILDQHVELGRAVVVGHSYTAYGEYDEHYTLCIDRTNSLGDIKYKMVNDVNTETGEIIKPTVCYKSSYQMRTMIKSQEAEIWLI